MAPEWGPFPFPEGIDGAAPDLKERAPQASFDGRQGSLLAQADQAAAGAPSLYAGLWTPATASQP
jgi:hypothetical protein